MKSATCTFMAARAPAGRRLHLQLEPCSFRAAVVLIVAAGTASGGPADVPLGDLLQIVATPRALLALDGEGGGNKREALERGETVLWFGTRGRVGVALTDRRVLAVGTGSGSWQTTRYRRGEARPASAGDPQPVTVELGDRVALVTTDRRLLGFDGGSGNLIDRSIWPQERVLQTEVAANVAVVVTSRRALGLSPFSGGFFETSLRVGENVERLETASEIATLVTSRRLLVFRGRSGSWSERPLELR